MSSPPDTPGNTLPERTSPQTLFRPEVLAERQAQWLGTVLLEPRVAHHVFVGIAALSALAVLALMFFGSYTRKERISGWLVPEQGLVRILPSQAGVVTQIQVSEGTQVEKGAPLVVLSTEVQSEAFGATRERIIQQLVSRRSNTEAEREVQEQLFDQQARDLRVRLDALAAEKRHLDQELELQSARLQLAEETLVRSAELRKRDLITLPRLVSAQEEKLDQAARFQTLERSRAELDREHAQVEGQLRELPFRQSIQLGEIDRNIAALEQEIAEAELRRQIIITAPQDGVVTAIQTEPGGTATPSVPLMSIVPEGAELQAHLFSPSRAIGFLSPGQKVLLRYQAFPYQKFGSYEGVIASLSRSALSPAEMTQQLAGLSSFYGANEPVYRITVDLDRQTATAYGEAVPLQPGMQLEADVLIETRRLVEWVLNPLFTLTGKWNG